jgi:multidrug efflux pump subunit AcrB
MSQEPFWSLTLGRRSFLLSRRGFTILAANLLLVFSFIAFGFLNNGVEFFPNTEPSQVTVTIETPPGTSLDVTNAIASIVEDRLAQIPGRKDVEFVVASIGTSDDPFDFGGQGTSNKGRIAINFYEKAKREQSSFATLEEARRTTVGLPGADLRAQKQQMGPPVGAPVSIEISGDDYDQLASLSRTVRQAIKDVPGLVDLKDDYNVGRPEIEVVVNRERAGMFWTSTGQAAGTVRAAISGIEASKYRIGEDEYKIRVRLQENQRTSLEDLQNVRINFMNRRGQQLSIPLSSVADVRRTVGVSDIRRKDQKRVITVSGEVEGRVQSAVLNEVKARLSGLELPPHYGIKFTGSEEQQNESSDFLQRAFLITLMLVFLIMVMEFNSTKIPFVIMLSVLLSLIGVMFGLIVTRTPFSIMMTGVGVVALAGIVVRNGIVLLDFVKHNRAEGHMDLQKALLEAGRVRLRPVLLTAAATVLGIMPLATGIDFDWRAGHLVVGAESASFWRPMGVAIIFGLTISTFLTLVVVPTAYAFLEEWTSRVGGWVRAKTRWGGKEE